MPVQSQNTPSIVPALLAVVGSVSATVVSAAVGASPTWRLAGAAVGAAIPPIVTTAGPYWRVRVASAVAVAASALVVTYGGFTLTDYVTNQAESTFPVVPALEPAAAAGDADGADDADDDAVDSGTSSVPTATDVTQCEGALCIRVTPATITCVSADCLTLVTVENAGSVELEINDVEFDGAAAPSYLLEGDCPNSEPLAPGTSCTMTVKAPDGGLGPARLVIHQNLAGPATYLDIEPGEETAAPADGVDLGLSYAPVCSVEPFAAADGSDLLSVRLDVGSSSAADLPAVPFAVTSSSGYSGGDIADFSSGSTPLIAYVALAPSDYETLLEVTVTLDAYDDIQETEESNNSRLVVIDLPARPDTSLDVDCSVP